MTFHGPSENICLLANESIKRCTHGVVHATLLSAADIGFFRLSINHVRLQPTPFIGHRATTHSANYRARYASAVSALLIGVVPGTKQYPSFMSLCVCALPVVNAVTRSLESTGRCGRQTEWFGFKTLSNTLINEFRHAEQCERRQSKRCGWAHVRKWEYLPVHCRHLWDCTSVPIDHTYTRPYI